MDKIRVLITGVGGGGHGDQIYQAINEKRDNYYIVATDMSSTVASLYSADKGYLLPPASDPLYLEKLTKICQDEKIQAIFHGSEPELDMLAENRKHFESLGILPMLQPTDIIQLCQDKWKTYTFLKENGFKTPMTIKVSKVEDLKEVDFFPVVVKPYLGGGGSKNVFLAQTEEELKFFTNYNLRQGNKVIIQEYVGDITEEYTVGVLNDFDGNLIGSLALNRVITSALSNRIKIKDYKTGKLLAISSGVSQGIVDDYPYVRQECEKISQALGSKGPLNIQCRLVKGELFVMEINPRFSGTSAIRAMLGFNEPDLLMRKHILKEELGSVKYKKGAVFRSLRNHYMSFEDLESLE